LEQKVIDLIKKYHRIVIITHQKPDGDGLGSSLALFYALEKLNKKIKLVCKDKIPSNFLSLSGIENFKKNFLMGDADLLITVDCGSIRRTGFSERIKKYISDGKKIINIDHHNSSDLMKLSALNLVDNSVAACSQIVFHLIQKLDIEIDKTVATSLMAGLYYDTGGFKHKNTDMHALNFASTLMSFGANKKDFTILSKHKINSLKLWGYALNKIEINDNGLAKVVITKKEMKNLNADEDNILGFANMIASMDQVKIAFIVWETDVGIRGMLRTKHKNINVSNLASYLGGGGLKSFAGFSMKCKLKNESSEWKVVDYC
jgi:phosphoesterase RecJ-like protein